MELGQIDIEVSSTVISYLVCEAEKDKLEKCLPEKDLEFLCIRRIEKNEEDEERSIWRITYKMEPSFNFRDALDDLQSRSWVNEVNWRTTRY